jgi:HD-GYP domain-containing protein (c-di-GMP phosphodiesterase class II)
VSAFESFAWTAAVHHEKLDGSGYCWGFTEERLDQSARALCVADIYDALTSDRPYRRGLIPDEAIAILQKDAGTALCARSVDAARELSKSGTWTMQAI